MEPIAGLRSYLFSVQLLQSNCNSPVVAMMMSVLVIYNFGVGLRQTTTATEILFTREQKAVQKKNEITTTSRQVDILKLIFPETLVEVFISNYTLFYLKKGKDKYS